MSLRFLAVSLRTFSNSIQHIEWLNYDFDGAISYRWASHCALLMTPTRSRWRLYCELSSWKLKNPKVSEADKILRYLTEFHVQKVEQPSLIPLSRPEHPDYQCSSLSNNADDYEPDSMRAFYCMRLNEIKWNECQATVRKVWEARRKHEKGGFVDVTEWFEDFQCEINRHFPSDFPHSVKFFPDAKPL